MFREKGRVGNVGKRRGEGEAHGNARWEDWGEWRHLGKREKLASFYRGGGSRNQRQKREVVSVVSVVKMVKSEQRSASL